MPAKTGFSKSRERAGIIKFMPAKTGASSSRERARIVESLPASVLESSDSDLPAAETAAEDVRRRWLK